MASRQHGAVSNEQLKLLGFTATVIQGRLESGHLHRIHRGVYAVGHPELTWEGRCMAATLACGLASHASHETGGCLWDFLERPLTFHVTAPTCRRHPGLVTHTATVPPDECAILGGIPLTNPSRTLLDLAATLPGRDLARAYDEADRLWLIPEAELRATLARANGHRGFAPLAALVEETFTPPPTKRELERLFYALCRDAGLIPPLVNVWVEGRKVDAYWPSQRLVVELDSRTFHRTDAKVERDYATSAELTLAGYTVLRFTWKQVTRNPEIVLALLRQALA